MYSTFVVMRRELASYSASSLANVFIITFLARAGGLTFKMGGLLEQG